MTPDRTDRIDAWCAGIGEEQRWAVYDKHARCPSWEACAEWAAAEFAVGVPSKAAYYRFRRRMAERESEHRIELALTEKARIGREMAVIGDVNPELKQAFEQRALESELKGEHKGAEKWMALALALGEAMNKRAKLELQSERVELQRQAEERAGDQLALMREKFEAQERRTQQAQETMKRLNEAGGLSAEARAEIEKAMGVL